MADYDLEALSLSELKKMQRDVARAISSYEDRQKAEARAKVEALARELGYSLAELVGRDRNPPVRLQRRSTGTLRTRRSPGQAEDANRSGSWKPWKQQRPRAIWPSVEGLVYAITAQSGSSPPSRALPRSFTEPVIRPSRSIFGGCGSAERQQADLDLCIPRDWRCCITPA
jgi:hypothetical protein